MGRWNAQLIHIGMFTNLRSVAVLLDAVAVFSKTHFQIFVFFLFVCYEIEKEKSIIKLDQFPVSEFIFLKNEKKRTKSHTMTNFY